MLPQPACSKRKCKHFLGLREDDQIGEPSQIWVCRAFLAGIPEEITDGDNLHTKPYPNDGGYQYEPGWDPTFLDYDELVEQGDIEEVPVPEWDELRELLKNPPRD